MRHFFSVLILLSLSVCVFATDDDQEQVESPSYQVTVTADRLEEPIDSKSDSIAVITQDDIERHQWRYVLDAVRQVPGVSVVQSGSPGKTTSVFLRGAGAGQVLVLIDGVQINNPYFGGVNWEDLSTDNVERIEVLKGPQSPLYGSDAIAGVIHIITRKGQGKTSVQASLEGGSYDTLRGQAGLQGGSANYDYSLSFSRTDFGGQFENDHFDENVFSGNGSYRWSETTQLRISGHVFDSNIGIPFHTVFDPMTFLPENEPSPLQRQDSNLSVLGMQFNQSPSEVWNFDLRFTYTHRDFFYEDPGTFFDESENRSNVYDISFQSDFRTSDFNTVTAGYEFEYQAVDARDSVNGAYDLENMNLNALYVQNKLELDRWILTAGLRFDHYNTFGNTVNPRISSAYRLQEQVKIRGSIGTGFRAPSAGDLGLPFYGNPDLKPEKSFSWEVGTDFNWNQVDFSVSWFHNDYKDLITFDPNTFIAGNVAEAMTQGLEVYGVWSYQAWTVSAGYTYLDTEDKTTGLPLYRRPEHSGSLRIAYQNTKWGGSLSLSALGDRFENDFLQAPVENIFLSGYTKMDLAGYYRIHPSVNLKARLENLMDNQYEEALYFPALGRAFYAGVEFKF